MHGSTDLLPPPVARPYEPEAPRVFNRDLLDPDALEAARKESLAQSQIGFQAIAEARDADTAAPTTVARAAMRQSAARQILEAAGPLVLDDIAQGRIDEIAPDLEAGLQMKEWMQAEAAERLARTGHTILEFTLTPRNQR